MDKHTAGEWVVRSGQTHFAEVVTPGPKGIVVIARVPVPQTKATTSERWAEAKANAALISGAPKLKAELERLTAWVMRRHAGQEINELVADALAAVAKVEGV